MKWKRQFSLGNELSILMIIASVFLLIGIVTNAFLVICVGVLFFLFIFANRYYLKHVGKDISVSVNKELIKLFKGEHDEFTITFSQESFLPFYHAHVRVTVDSIVEFENERKVLETEQVELHLPISLVGKQALTYTLPFYARNRGVAKIRTIELRIPHLFGFGEVYLQYSQPVKFETIIYSSPVAVGGIERIFPKNQGTYPIKTSYFEDMTAIVGARQYVSSDPFNRIHWKASARTNELQTKLFDKTAQFSWTIMINVRERYLEEHLSGLTYLLEYATVKNIPFEIFVNIRKVGKSPFVHHQMGTGKEHLAKALELIARLSKHSITLPFHIMGHTVLRQNQISPFVIISGELEEHEQLIVRGFSKRQIDSFKLLENDGAVILRKISEHDRKVISDAI